MSSVSRGRYAIHFQNRPVGRLANETTDLSPKQVYVNTDDQPIWWLEPSQSPGISPAYKFYNKFDPAAIVNDKVACLVQDPQNSDDWEAYPVDDGNGFIIRSRKDGRFWTVNWNDSDGGIIPVSVDTYRQGDRSQVFTLTPILNN